MGILKFIINSISNWIMGSNYMDDYPPEQEEPEDDLGKKNADE